MSIMEKTRTVVDSGRVATGNNRKGHEGTPWDKEKRYIDPEVSGGSVLVCAIYFEMNFFKK